jgi:predicted SAM-dependent methyltransferase
LSKQNGHYLKCMAKLNIGCGSNWKLHEGYDGLDKIDYGQKYVSDVLNMDIYKDPNQFCNFKSETYDEVMANHFLEHFSQDELRFIFLRVHDILKPKGLFKIVVPHKDKESSWRLSHKTFWCEGTIKWLETKEADEVYGFGRWSIKEIITNSRGDIHAWLIKIC